MSDITERMEKYMERGVDPNIPTPKAYPQDETPKITSFPISSISTISNDIMKETRTRPTPEYQELQRIRTKEKLEKKKNIIKDKNGI